MAPFKTRFVTDVISQGEAVLGWSGPRSSMTDVLRRKKGTQRQDSHVTRMQRLKRSSHSQDARGPQKLEEARKDLPLQVSEEGAPTDTLILDFRPPDRFNKSLLV